MLDRCKIVRFGRKNVEYYQVQGLKQVVARRALAPLEAVYDDAPRLTGLRLIRREEKSLCWCVYWIQSLSNDAFMWGSMSPSETLHEDGGRLKDNCCRKY